MDGNVLKYRCLICRCRGSGVSQAFGSAVFPLSCHLLRLRDPSRDFPWLGISSPRHLPHQTRAFYGNAAEESSARLSLYESAEHTANVCTLNTLSQAVAAAPSCFKRKSLLSSFSTWRMRRWLAIGIKRGPSLLAHTRRTIRSAHLFSLQPKF